jgi:hypothetical protein
MSKNAENEKRKFMNVTTHKFHSRTNDERGKSENKNIFDPLPDAVICLIKHSIRSIHFHTKAFRRHHR